MTYKYLLIFLCGLLGFTPFVSAQEPDALSPLQKNFIAYDRAIADDNLNRAAELALMMQDDDFSGSPFTLAQIWDVKAGFADTLKSSGQFDLAMSILERIMWEETIHLREVVDWDPKEKSYAKETLANRHEKAGDWYQEAGIHGDAILNYKQSHSLWIDVYGKDFSAYSNVSEDTNEEVYKTFTGSPGAILTVAGGPTSLENFIQEMKIGGIYRRGATANLNPAQAPLTGKIVHLLTLSAKGNFERGAYGDAFKDLNDAYRQISEQCSTRYPGPYEICSTSRNLDIREIVYLEAEYWVFLADQFAKERDFTAAYYALRRAKATLQYDEFILVPNKFFDLIRVIDARSERVKEEARKDGYEITAGVIKTAAPRTAIDKNNFETIRVFYGTNRSKLDLQKVENAYSANRGPMVWGTIDMTVPRNREIGDLGALGRRDKNGAIDGVHIVLKRIQPVSPSDFTRELQASVTGSRHAEKEAFVYVHGHGVTFANAARRTAQLAVDLDIRGGGTFFSWPAGNPSRGYRKSETEVGTASRYLAEFITRIANESGADRLHIFAHSMGNRILMPALKQVQKNGELQSEQPFDQIVWASPDNDAQQFAASIAEIAPLAEDMTLYASRNDQALRISKWVMHSGRHRAGQSPVHSDILKQANFIDAIDTSQVGGKNDRLGHTDYVGGAITDLQSIVWLSLEPEQRCIDNVSDESGVAVFWRTEYQSCSQDELRRALITMRHQGQDKAIGYAQSSLALSSKAGDGADTRTWRGALSLMNDILGPAQAK